MATNYFNVRVNSGNETLQPVVSGEGWLSLSKLADLFSAYASGCRFQGSAQTITIDTSAATASGTLTISSGSGTVGGTINGVSVTVTWGTSDTATATALAAAINASGNALVNKHVTASAAAGVVTLTSNFPGYQGNAVTLAASGTGVTASGARLTGGTATIVTLSV